MRENKGCCWILPRTQNQPQYVHTMFLSQRCGKSCYVCIHKEAWFWHYYVADAVISSVYDGSWPIVHETLWLCNDRRTRRSGSSFQLRSGELLTDFSVRRKGGEEERDNRRDKSRSLTEDCIRANNKHNKYSYQSRKASSWKRDLQSTRVSPVHQFRVVWQWFIKKWIGVR